MQLAPPICSSLHNAAVPRPHHHQFTPPAHATHNITSPPEATLKRSSCAPPLIYRHPTWSSRRTTSANICFLQSESCSIARCDRALVTNSRQAGLSVAVALQFAAWFVLHLPLCTRCMHCRYVCNTSAHDDAVQHCQRLTTDACYDRLSAAH
jgi:hypothetical protein